MPRCALILIGGYGTRLRPLTFTKPKPLIPFLNKPILFHQIDSLSKSGCTKIVLAVCSRDKSTESFIIDYYKHSNIEIIFSYEEVPLGTAGPLLLARKYLTFPCYVLNADITCDYPFSGMLEFHRRKKAVATILTTAVQDPSRYGVVVGAEDLELVGEFVEKPKMNKCVLRGFGCGAVEHVENLTVLPESSNVSNKNNTLGSNGSGIIKDFVRRSQDPVSGNSKGFNISDAVNDFRHNSTIMNHPKASNWSENSLQDSVSSYADSIPIRVKDNTETFELKNSRINAGVYIIEEDLLDYIPVDKEVSIEKEVFPVLATERKLAMFPLKSHWMDIGQPKDYLIGTKMLIESGICEEVLKGSGNLYYISGSAEGHKKNNFQGCSTGIDISILCKNISDPQYSSNRDVHERNNDQGCSTEKNMSALCKNIPDPQYSTNCEAYESDSSAYHLSGVMNHLKCCPTIPNRKRVDFYSLNTGKVSKTASTVCGTPEQGNICPINKDVVFAGRFKDRTIQEHNRIGSRDHKTAQNRKKPAFNWDLVREEAAVNFSRHESSIIQSVIHESAQIGYNNKIGPNVVIGKNVIIGNNCTLTDCCIFENTVIHNNVRITDSIIGWKCQIKDNAAINGVSVLGNEVLVESGVVLSNCLVNPTNCCSIDAVDMILKQ